MPHVHAPVDPSTLAPTKPDVCAIACASLGQGTPVHWAHYAALTNGGDLYTWGSLRFYDGDDSKKIIGTSVTTAGDQMIDHALQHRYGGQCSRRDVELGVALRPNSRSAVVLHDAALADFDFDI